MKDVVIEPVFGVWPSTTQTSVTGEGGGGAGGGGGNKDCHSPIVTGRAGGYYSHLNAS